MKSGRTSASVLPLHDAGRRRAMQLVVALAAAFSPRMAWAAAAARAAVQASGYGKDPDLKAARVPWSRILTPQERATLSEFADAVIPSDSNGPGAVALGVVEFLDEWLSAPYEEQQTDLTLIRPALAALDRVPGPQSLAEILAQPGRFEADLSACVARVRTLVIIGWGTAPQAAAQLNFIGNEPRLQFEGPPAAVLALLRARAAALAGRPA
jgi:hypothetical protein